MDLDALVADYLLSWTTTDEQVRREALQRCWSPDGTVKIEGTDIGGLDAEGRLLSITGFFGPL